MPKPDKLLRLAVLVGLTPPDLIVRSDAVTPVVAFRKKGAAKTTERHIARAQQMGAMLRPLVAHLPFDEFVKPSSLKSPSTDYSYLQSLVSSVRKDIGVGHDSPIDFPHLIKRFQDTQTVLVPVLWGQKGHHENALHIFLPDSTTTWVFLNLDVEIHDFKFWMAHELGHVLAPELRGDAAEDFADAFAGALLLPEAAAKETYESIISLSNAGLKINKIKDVAEKFLISPLGVYMQVNSFAKHHSLKQVQLEPAIYGASKNLSKNYHCVSEALFSDQPVVAKELVKFCREELNSPFFEALGAYLKISNKGAGFVQSVLEIPAIDAIAIQQEIA